MCVFQFRDLIIVADNVAYDICVINYHYDVKLGRAPINYKSNGSYRVIVDQNSYLWAFLPLEKDPWVSDSQLIQKYNLSLTTLANHLPENDAERILEIMLMVMPHNKNKV